MSSTAHPQPLVSTQWMSEHLDDPTIRLIEVDLDPDNYANGHLPGAVLWRLWVDLLLPDERVNDDPAAIGQLLSRSGVSPESTVILYGDFWNWGATLAYWLLDAIGHRDMRVMDGGRRKWLDEGRVVTNDAPAITPTSYAVGQPDWSVRARLDEVRQAIGSTQQTILDVRLPEEYSGELFRPGAAPQEGQQAGHIPGAIHVPWEMAINDDGAFKQPQELRALYEQHGVRAEQEIIPYCTVGGRSSHTWFALTQLADYTNVRLYDASWAEWGQTKGLPVD